MVGGLTCPVKCKFCASFSLTTRRERVVILRKLHFHWQATGGTVDPQLCAEMKPKVATLVETLYHFNTSQAHDSTRFNIRHTQMLLKDMNFVYPVRHRLSLSARRTLISIPSIGNLGWWKTS